MYIGRCKSYCSCKSEVARVIVLVNRKWYFYCSQCKQMDREALCWKMIILAKEKKTGVSVLRCMKNKQPFKSMNMPSKSDPPEYACINWKECQSVRPKIFRPRTRSPRMPFAHGPFAHQSQTFRVRSPFLYLLFTIGI